MKPRIGLTAALTITDDGRPPRVGINRSYVSAVHQAGGVPLLIPPGTGDTDVAALVETLDGLLLPGGVDVNPSYYGEERHPTTVVSDTLDELELPLTRAFLAAKKPILAICRGIQVLNVAAGGSLFQDVPSQRDRGVTHTASGTDRTYVRHRLAMDPTSRLARVLGTCDVAVNSMHHQAIKDVGAGLRATGVADDDLWEAVEAVDPDHFAIGVQCHPEELVAIEPAWRGLFSAFVDAAREASDRGGYHRPSSTNWKRRTCGSGTSLSW